MTNSAEPPDEASTPKDDSREVSKPRSGADSRLRRFMIAAAAPLGAFIFSLIASAIVLLAAGSNPIEACIDMLRYASGLDVQVSMLNRATPLYISGVAAAIGFKMNLFNIGVEGQYRMAAIFAAFVGGAVVLPSVLHIGLILLTAMLVGAAWGGLAGILYTHRGVNEVIGTIMLNGIALGIIAWLVRSWQAGGGGADAIGEFGVGTTPIEPSGLLPNLNFIPELFGEIRQNTELTGVLVIAIVVGVAYYLLLNRTIFGFDLRASGLNPLAARAGGVPPRRMALAAMLMSGAVAGLVGMAEIFDAGRYNPNFVGFLGFNGIAVALLGRNNPVGIAAGALLWAFLDASSDVLQSTETAPKEIIDIMRGIILLTVVIGYEVVRRIKERSESVRTAARLAEAQE